MQYQNKLLKISAFQNDIIEVTYRSGCIEMIACFSQKKNK